MAKKPPPPAYHNTLTALLASLGALEKLLADDAASAAKSEVSGGAASAVSPDPAASPPSSIYPPDDLKALISKASSPFPLPDLTREVVGILASTSDPEKLQPSLFSLLGDANIETIFALFSVADQVKSSIEELGVKMYAELAAGSAAPRATAPQATSEEDAATLLAVAAAANENRNYLRSKTNANHGAPQLVGVSVKRTSDKKLRKSIKAANKAAKNASAAASYLTDAHSDFLEDVGFDPEYLEQERMLGLQGGGFRGASEADIAAIRAALDPEGSKHFYEKQSLPSGTTREYEDGYEIVRVPAKFRDEDSLPPRVVLAEAMDKTCLKGFQGIKTLNPMQSKVYEAAFKTQENLLICAPTGAGKTNVAMLTVLAHFRDKGIIANPDDPYAAYQNVGSSDGQFEKGTKVIYIAPMKALAQEVVEKFSARLKPLSLQVRELTGDMQLTRSEAEKTDVIVTTPEKWDVVTRKGGDGSLSQSCGLLIIDEVHLLADGRGAVIESVVARLHRLVESSQRSVRIVGLSATLPNYQDVALFLRVHATRGLFYFGPEHRPVPLSQNFIGVTEKDRWRQIKKMNEVCYDIVTDSLRRGYQVMVFVHSRKDTGQTSGALAEIAAKRGELERYFLTSNDPESSYTKWAPKANKSRNREVSGHFRNGMGIHHAGMLRGDRKLSEQMFADGAIKVLCCTATLAWGVNLPAHSVVIKGTQVYNAEKGGMMDLSILDVQQIFGRAGRPQFDTFGEAHLITSHASLPRYLNLLVHQSPIESNFIKQLADHLNAEVVGGTVCNIAEAAQWLQYTYLYVRMLKNPMAYGIDSSVLESDPQLKQKTTELVQSAAKLLDERRMLRYDPRSGNLAVTDHGRVASHFYIQNESVATFNELLSRIPHASDADLMHVICNACEFVNVKVRQEELKEIDQLLASSCPLAVTATADTSPGKSNILLQAFICKAKITSFTLISDTNYIASNAGRVARALFEMCLRRGNAGHASKFLKIAKTIDKRVWWYNTPLRQFAEDLPNNIFPALESRGYGSYDYALSLLDMTDSEVGQAAHWQKGGSTIKRILRFNIELASDFDWHGKWGGGAQGFWLWVEDSENERIYHHEYIVLSKRNHPETLNLDLTIPAFEPLPPQYYLVIVSDRFVGVELTYPVSFQHLLLPDRHLPYTDLADITPLPTTALSHPPFESLYNTKFECFNPIQSQLFHVLYHTDKSVLLGAPTGSGKTIVAELALLRLKRISPANKCVYIAPLKSLARERLKEWRKNLGSKLNWQILELSGDTSHDARTMSKADVLVCTPEKWDLISRGWRDSGRDFVKQCKLLIIDEIHLLGEERGAVLEAIVSRTRYISEYLKAQCEPPSSFTPTRILGLSTALSNPRDLAEWMGIDFDPPHNGIGMYNFRPSVRPVPQEVHIQGFPGRAYCPRMATMNKPCYAAIKEHSPNNPVIIFVASRRQTRLTALDLISFAAGDEDPRLFLHGDVDIDAICSTISDTALKHTLSFGIGLHHAGLSSADRDVVETLFLDGTIQVLCATSTLAWGVNLPARLVIVKGTEFFDGKTSRYVDYPVTDVLQMMGRAGRPQFDTVGIACILVQEGKKNFYRKFLYEPFPVESCLKNRIHEILNAEIATETVTSKSDAAGYMRWTYYYRRLLKNPSFYFCEGDVDDFLKELVDKTVGNLAKHGCIKLIERERQKDEVAFLGSDDDRIIVASTGLGRATCKYYLLHQSASEFLEGLRELKGNLQEAKSEGMDAEVLETGCLHHILKLVTASSEFNEIPVRHNEEHLNEELAGELRWGEDKGMDFEDPHTKAFLLVQAWLERGKKLPISDYTNDTRTVVDQLGRLFAAMLTITQEDGEGASNCMLDVAYSILVAEQCVGARCYAGRGMIFQQVDGIVKGGAEPDSLSEREALTENVLDSIGLGGLRELKARSLKRGGDDALIKSLKGARCFKAGTVLSSLKRLSFVERVSSVRKVWGKSGGGGVRVTLELRITPGEGGGRRRGGRGGGREGTEITVLFGKAGTRELLAVKRVGGGGKTRSVEVEIAGVSVEDEVVVKVVVGGVVGMDLEFTVDDRE
ncbi:hypothetical protein TrRE_jg2330 [Triparma retinervis]|uniref:U5 small nuclear ribonucleoprotein 200 kDa helicase n=1 Tax=Triparma retinervis TaxID=2557542 RepID=A0A9W6ZG61_9STRA|nr:hypothetical protein TrRE_jg2330 [Triparma retinervis]